MDSSVIELVNLTKKYGSFTAVDNLTLSIHKSEIFGLLGPNGAGKSTSILMMLGLTEPTSGSVTLCGFNATTHPIEVKRKVGYLPEEVGFYNDRTGLQNLIYTARLNQINPEEAKLKASNLLSRVGLANEAGKKAGNYSRGMRQRLGLADVLIKNPEVIILDEPTSGIDPKGVKDFLQLIVELSREEGITVLFSSHNLHQVQQVCDRVGLFVHGKLIAEGDIQTLSQKLFSSDPLIIEAGLAPVSEKTSQPFVPESLPEQLKSIDGVLNVKYQEPLFYIGCAKDVTTDIAKTIVLSGAGLNFLAKKEYGLDDIYNRYFEGGEHHG